jgi:hypothetical protein
MPDSAARKYPEATPEAVAAYIAECEMAAAAKARMVPPTTGLVPSTISDGLVPPTIPLVPSTTGMVPSTISDKLVPPTIPEKVLDTKMVPPTIGVVPSTKSRHGKYAGRRTQFVETAEEEAFITAEAKGRPRTSVLRQALKEMIRRKRTEF